MNNLNGVLKVISDRQDKFEQIDKANGNILNFETECLFAKQQLLKNNYTLGVATKNQNSLASAILNIAAVGLSLNPAQQHAYLVPRDNQICLDISYRGLIQIGIDTGAIEWCRPEVVKAKDKFLWRGPTAEPTHEADVFSDRGDMVGVYCVTKLKSGDIFCGTMSLEEIHKIRDKSKAYTKSKAGPWAEWPEEMAKKSIIKRDYKTWPQSNIRLGAAVEVLNSHEGTCYTIQEHEQYMEALHRKDWHSFAILRHKFSEQQWIALYNSFEKGHKVEGKKLSTELEKTCNNELESIAVQLGEAIDSDDDTAISEIVESFASDFNEENIFNRLSPEHQTFIDAFVHGRADLEGK